MLCMFNTGTLSLTNRYLSWKIYNFHSLPLNVGSEIRSPEFMYGYTHYTLVIWPRGRKGTGTEEWFGICLYKMPDAPRSNDSVEFSIATAVGRAIKTCTVQCSEYNLFREEHFMEWSDFLALGPKIVPDGCLTILCRLPAVNANIQKDNIPGVCLTRPMNHPPVKFQSGDNHMPDPQTTLSLLKLKSHEEQVSSAAISGVDCGPPSKINSFYSTPSRENSLEFVSGARIDYVNEEEFIATQNPHFKLPYNAPIVEGGNNTFWRLFTRGYRDSNRNKPEVVLSPAADVAEESIPTPSHDSTTMSPEVANAGDNSNNPEVNSSNSVATTSSNAFLSHSGYVANSAPNSYPRSNPPGEPPSSAPRCLRGLKILSEQIKSIYFIGNGDLTIIMGGKEFKVVSWILKARSPYFDELLSENTNNVITIDPFGACDSSVFHDFLLYIYSGEIENLSLKNVHGIHRAACKFRVPDLKEECIEFLIASLSVDTITDILRSADSNDSELLDVALVFLAKNLEVVMNTDEWKQFTGEEPNRVIQYQLKALHIGYTKTI